MRNSPEYVEKDFPFLKFEWPALRVGWVLLAAFVIAGALGLFGSGIISDKTVDSGVATLQYERYLRSSTPSQIVIAPRGSLPDSSIYFNSSYLKKVKIDKIAPEPVSVDLSGGRVRFKFSSAETESIIFHIVPFADAGAQSLEIEMGGNRQVLRQFIYF